MNRRLLCLLLSITVLLACSDPVDDTREPEHAPGSVHAARVAQYRAAIPAHVEELCARYGTSESEQAEACRQAGRAFMEAVATKIEISPPGWEKKIVALSATCTREAFQWAQSEAPGRSEPQLLVEGLEKGPACLDKQYALLQKRAREASAG